MRLVERVLGCVGAFIKTLLAFSSGHSGDHFSWSIFTLLLLISPFFAAAMKLKFEDSFQK